jgi:hypothetical protein
MYRKLILSAVWAIAAVCSAHSYDIAAIMKKVSENSDKIVSYKADAQVRYKI